MQKTKILILLSVLLSMSFVSSHDFYLSTTTVKLVPEKQQLQLTSRFFIDDIEAYMQQKQNSKVVFSPDSHPDETDAFIEAFFNDNLTIRVNDISQKTSYLGREYQDDLLVIYAEISSLTLEFRRLELASTFLLDFIENQQNIFHVQTPTKKKSFLLKNKAYSLEFELK